MTLPTCTTCEQSTALWLDALGTDPICTDCAGKCIGETVADLARGMDLTRIITSHVYPPIPDRRFDWCAHRDGREEDGNYGWGRTEAEAITDLIENVEMENENV